MTVARWAAVLATMLIAACQSQPGPTMSFGPAPRVGPPLGVDLPNDASDVLSELRGSRLDFVARYYRDPASRWPTLTASEVRRLSALGLKIVAVWESHSGTPAYFSYASGYSDASNAYRQAKGIGQPPGSAIYFAVDFNATGADFEQVVQYFRGIAAGMAAVGQGRPEYRVGVYGSGAVCDALKRARLAQYAWLSNAKAWVGSAGYTGWNIRQSGRFPSLSFNHDANEAREDYGAFRLDASAPEAARVVTAPPSPPESSFATAIRSWF